MFNFKNYLIAIRWKEAIFAYITYAVIYEIRIYFNNEPFDWSLVPPYVFNNSAVVGIMIFVLVSPLFGKLFSLKEDSKLD